MPAELTPAGAEKVRGEQFIEPGYDDGHCEASTVELRLYDFAGSRC